MRFKFVKIRCLYYLWNKDQVKKNVCFRKHKLLNRQQFLDIV